MSLVFATSAGERLTKKTKRITIGRATSQTMMHPNDNFREMYPQLWTKYYKEDAKERTSQLSAGMYELLLGIGYRTGLYPALQKVFGPAYANIFMDFALFSNIIKSNSITFREGLRNQAIFSEDRVDDDWISDFLF